MTASNEHLEKRLSGMHQMLMGVHAAGASLSNSTKGTEREAFINGFLADILPPQVRFGSGDATDRQGNRSGQLDVVLEFPFVPSLPLVSGRSPRLYLAEGIAAVIEVKSNLEKQWDDVVATAQQLAKLDRSYGTGVSIGPRPMPKIPLYAVGYEGWTTLPTLQKKLQDHPTVSGILVMKSLCFSGRYDYFKDDKGTADVFSYERAESPMALWGLISCLHHAISLITSSTKNVPRQYDPPAA